MKIKRLKKKRIGNMICHLSEVRETLTLINKALSSHVKAESKKGEWDEEERLFIDDWRLNLGKQIKLTDENILRLLKVYAK